jgi:signal transduction histidine kinase
LIAEAHGGDVTVASTEGIGTTATVGLPVLAATGGDG